MIFPRRFLQFFLLQFLPVGVEADQRGFLGKVLHEVFHLSSALEENSDKNPEKSM